MDEAKAALPHPPARARPQAQPHRPPLKAVDLDARARRALQHFAPAYVVVDRDRRIVHFGGDTGRWLAPASGAASLDVFQMLPRTLACVVNEAVTAVFDDGRASVREHLAPPRADCRPLRLIVTPLHGRDGTVDACVVGFDEMDAPAMVDDDCGASGDQARLCALEAELEATRAQLRAAVEMHEQVEAELGIVNERYRLVNETLVAANAQLRESVRDIGDMSDQLHAVESGVADGQTTAPGGTGLIQRLLREAPIALVLLDRELRIVDFSQATSELFRLRDEDRGRPLTDIACSFDHPHLASDLERALSQGDVVERLLTHSAGQRVFLLRACACGPQLPGVDADAAGMVLACVDVSAALSRKHADARLAAIINSSRDAVIGFSLYDRITDWNPAAERIFGFTTAEALGMPLARLLADERSPEAEDFFAGRRRDGGPAQFEMTWRRPDGEKLHLELLYSPVRDSEGKQFAGELSARDISERRLATQRMELMVAELNHRVKNTMATVQAIIAQTLQSTPDPAVFSDRLLARLLALAKAHTALSRHAWRGISLAEMIATEMEPWQRAEAGRVDARGEELALPAKHALALSMALHELTTNAGKYGALSTDGGCLAIRWCRDLVDGQPWLRMDWSEHGGPPVTAPRHHGFGSRLLREGLAYELGGSVALEFPREGLHCVIRIPLDPPDDAA